MNEHGTRARICYDWEQQQPCPASAGCRFSSGSRPSWCDGRQNAFQATPNFQDERRKSFMETLLGARCQLCARLSRLSRLRQASALLRWLLQLHGSRLGIAGSGVLTADSVHIVSGACGEGLCTGHVLPCSGKAQQLDVRKINGLLDASRNFAARARSRHCFLAATNMLGPKVLKPFNLRVLLSCLHCWNSWEKAWAITVDATYTIPAA